MTERRGSKACKVPFTDNNKLMYLSEAKRFTRCQTRWVLFLSYISYVVSYFPRSKNVKTDALSRQYSVFQGGLHADFSHTSDPDCYPHLLNLSPWGAADIVGSAKYFL